MAKSQFRILFLIVFVIVSYLWIQKSNTSLTRTIRSSRHREGDEREIVQPHVGKLSDYVLKRNNLKTHSSSLLNFLSFDKKINTYFFTNYNWYHFQVRFVDLTYDSYIEIKWFSDDFYDGKAYERIGFNLDDAFYPDGGKIKIQPKEGQKCCGCTKAKGMNFDLKKNGFSLSVRQQTIKNMSDDRHDGYMYSRFWYYTPNKTIDDPSNNKFKSDLTVTTFNISYHGKESSFDANLTHVLRHNQCFSVLDENTGVFKHKCLGGYGTGRVFLDRKINNQNLVSHGKTVKSVYNLENNRTRTGFEGIRSTKRISKAVSQQNIIPRTNWEWKEMKMYMYCFSKPEYYQKFENIEKERLIGLHFARTFKNYDKEIIQDYLFVNGNIHQIRNMDYKVDQNYNRFSNITVRGIESKDFWQPQFEFNFTILSTDKTEQNDVFGERNELRAYGFWTGYVDEGKRGEKVSFFNITGFIETTNSLY